MKKFFKYFLLFLVLLVVAFFLGPKVKYDAVKILDTEIQTSLADLEHRVHTVEANVSNLKPDNQARIVWANDSTKVQTEYCLLYMHGFSASQMEGDPVHRNFAKRYGMNLYLARLEDHGRADTNSLMGLTPDKLIQSAEDAVDIAKKLGKKVIIMSCSTGGTLTAILAAAGEDIHSMIMYSPNIDLYDPMSEALLYPWGKQISRLVMGGDYNRINYTPDQAKHWNSIYHMDGVFALKSIIKTYMTPETFGKIKQPLFMGYFYKDEENQDKVVSVKRMHEFFDQVATPADKKVKKAFPEAGHHVISSHLMSRSIPEVEQATYDFAEKVLGLQPVK
jgi:esterase/lipase